jgi:hypothetical protein
MVSFFYHTANTCPSGEFMPSSHPLSLRHEKAARTVGPVGLPCVTWRFPYPFSHPFTTRIPPLALHAGQSRNRRYFQLSKICQIHRKSISETLRCDDTALQIVLRDLSGETRSNGRTEKVLMPRNYLSSILISSSPLASSRLSRTPSELQSMLERNAATLQIPPLLRQKKS